MAKAKNKVSRYAELKELIEKHNRLYYVDDRPEISDYEYDQLWNELLEIEKNSPELKGADSPSHRVGGEPIGAFEKVRHRQPMLSLSNTYNPEELVEFDERTKKFLASPDEIEYFCEPKFDGLAVELIYENGLLTNALTRGDGVTGENVTHNVRTIRTIPLRLKTNGAPPLVEIRGEILLQKKDFITLNEKQEEAGLRLFANSRNAAAGTIRQLDAKITAQRPLAFFAHSLGASEGVQFRTHAQMLQTFETWNVPIAKPQKKFVLLHICLGIKKVLAYYEKLHEKRENLPYDIDGCVVKVNSFHLQQELGLVARSPRWAAAAKYAPEQAETTIENIVVQVGRTGVLTPVAVMKAVQVGGVSVTNATLHNEDELKKKDVRIGDTVIVQRAGDVIPEVVSVVLTKRAKSAREFIFPTHCPACGEPVERFEGEVAIRCVNPLCIAVLKESLKHFVSRRAMNIEKVGDRLIEALVDEKKVKRFSDLYTLKRETLFELERQGEKSVQNILASIEKSKRTTLDRLIYALGIRFVGEQTAKSLAQKFGDWKNFLKADEKGLLEIDDVGPKVAESILRSLTNEHFHAEVKRLIELGIELEAPRQVGSKLAGQRFLITGTLPVKRDEAQQMILENGGQVASAVSASLDCLIVGAEAGSKLAKAEALDIRIVDWDGFLELIK